MTSRDDQMEWFRDRAADLTWTFAKTMAQHPHEYIVRSRTVAPDTFLQMAKIIRRYGEPGKFYRSTICYLHLDGYKYWTMGAPLQDTTIINRTDDPTTYGPQDAPSTKPESVTDLAAVYDQLSPDYDARYDRPECHAENRVVARHVKEISYAAARVLDVGAGTGLALDLQLAAPHRYTALDPSQGMLNELVRKHPIVTDVRAEPFTADTDVYGYDLVLALFGVPSYLTPEAIESIPGRLTDRGRAVLMAFRPGYWPSYLPAEPATAAPALAAITALAGVEVQPMTNYLIATI